MQNLLQNRLEELNTELEQTEKELSDTISDNILGEDPSLALQIEVLTEKIHLIINEMASIMEGI